VLLSPNSFLTSCFPKSAPEKSKFSNFLRRTGTSFDFGGMVLTIRAEFVRKEIGDSIFNLSIQNASKFLKGNVSMKKILLIFICLWFFAVSTSAQAQTYPFWDLSEPGTVGLSYGFGYEPILASSNAVFSFDVSSDPYGPAAVVARWTKCGGWEDIGPINADTLGQAFLNSVNSMTIYSNYLYCVGDYILEGTNELNIVKFDLNTGVWSPVGDGYINTVTNVRNPLTIAIATNGYIYVGFAIVAELGGYYPDGYAGMAEDMLDVSTNNGATWQEVGTGMVVVTDADGSVPTPGITTLYADGTNIYVGGDFDGANDGILSRRLIMWDGNSWHHFGTDNPDLFDDAYTFGYEIGLFGVNDIAVAGTNVYVAAGLISGDVQPLLRFSSVSGDLLSLSDFDISDNGGGEFGGLFGISLSLNNGNLYLGGAFVFDDALATNIVCLTDPADANPTGWTGFPDSQLVEYPTLAATANSSAVYVNGVSGPQFARWMVASDGPDPEASITGYSYAPGGLTLTVVGTPGSHWQVIESVDGSSWHGIGAVTLWSGANTFTDTGYSFGETVSYQLTNNCSESAAYSAPIFTSNTLVNVQFANPGAIQQTGPAALGSAVYTNDYWNMVPGETNYDGDTPSGIVIDVCASFAYSGDPPICSFDGSGSVPMLNNTLITAGDPFKLALYLPAGHTYDIYLYGYFPWHSPARYTSTFTITNYSGRDSVTLSDWSPLTTSSADYTADNFIEGNQYIVFTGLVPGNWTIQASGSVPSCNGLQILIH
jgi:hypothetical protein